MMKSRVFVVAFLTLLIAAACSSSPKSRFYTLDVAYEGPTRALNDFQIGVGPFEMVRYLDRPQIVTRGAGNRLTINEFDRWADALPDRFNRVLARNLVLATGSTSILAHPWRRDFDAKYRVTGVVDRFEADRDGTVVLEVRWAILGVADSMVEETFRAVYTRDAKPDDFGAIASAMSHVLADFAADIATDLAARPALPDH